MSAAIKQHIAFCPKMVGSSQSSPSDVGHGKDALNTPFDSKQSVAERFMGDIKGLRRRNSKQAITQPNRRFGWELGPGKINRFCGVK
jgi:hypothetical protein